MKQYQLYHDKESATIELKPLKKTFLLNVPETNTTMINYNDYYYLGVKPLLKQKALELKEQWIKELKQKLSILENIKI